MAKRVKTSKQSPKSVKSQTILEAAERVVVRQSNKILVAATKRYKRFVRQASKATNDANKKKYLAAALTAVIIAGVVAQDLKTRIDKRAKAATVRKKETKTLRADGRASMSQSGHKRTNRPGLKTAVVRSCPITDKLLRCRNCPLSANSRHCTLGLK